MSSGGPPDVELVRDPGCRGGAAHCEPHGCGANVGAKPMPFLREIMRNHREIIAKPTLRSHFLVRKPRKRVPNAAAKANFRVENRLIEARPERQSERSASQGPRHQTTGPCDDLRLFKDL